MRLVISWCILSSLPCIIGTAFPAGGDFLHQLDAYSQSYIFFIVDVAEELVFMEDIGIKSRIVSSF